MRTGINRELPSTNTAVQCRGVTKAYGTGDAQVKALRGIDLNVLLGEVLMLVGPSGCGKTTLISVISSILDQDSGECTVLGRDLLSMSSEERIRFRRESIGFVFQTFNLFPTITAMENVTIPLLLNNVPKTKAEDRAKEVLDAVGLGARINALPSQLSGGQQQRIAVARALAHNPKLILCDEPTSSLDHKTGHSVMEMLKRVAHSPERAVIIVTHDARIFEFADRIAYMDDGKIVKVTAANDLRHIQ